MRGSTSAEKSREDAKLYKMNDVVHVDVDEGRKKVRRTNRRNVEVDVVRVRVVNITQPQRRRQITETQDSDWIFDYT